MSAILSADDLNDFISPSVACIKPVETLPQNQAAKDPDNPYEVTTEDAAAAKNAPPAQISLTDCLACSGCVTSAEAILVSLQSYQEVLTTLDAYSELPLPRDRCELDSEQLSKNLKEMDGKIFIASISPQARASIAATFGVSERAAGNMIQQLLSGAQGLRSGGRLGSGFTWVLDTNALREMALVAATDDMDAALAGNQNDEGDFTRRDHTAKKPVLTSACPGWICYAEKTHPHVLPHISKLKSPQALAGTLVKTLLSRKYGIPTDKIWHMAVMPCFDKKLEASREELTDGYWTNASPTDTQATTTTGIKGVRDVDLVITSRELLSLAEARNITFSQLSRRPVPQAQRIAFPDVHFDSFLFPRVPRQNTSSDAGSSGGYLWHMIKTMQSRHMDSRVTIQRGRNSDVIEYTVVPSNEGPPLFRAARFYGFRNIQNLVRRLRPARASRMPAARRLVKPSTSPTVDAYDYVEVMACPGGCTNGGGQIKAEDAAALRAVEPSAVVPMAEADKIAQRTWLAQVDEAYFSASSGEDTDEDDGEYEATTNQVFYDKGEDEHIIDGISHAHIRSLIAHWASITGVSEEALLRTTYRHVKSDVGKKASDVERVAGLASSIGGGW